MRDWPIYHNCHVISYAFLSLNFGGKGSTAQEEYNTLNLKPTYLQVWRPNQPISWKHAQCDRTNDILHLGKSQILSRLGTSCKPCHRKCYIRTRTLPEQDKSVWMACKINSSHICSSCMCYHCNVSIPILVKCTPHN